MDPFKKINEEDREELLRRLEASSFHFPKNTSILQTIKTDNLFGIVIKGGMQIIRTDYDGRRIIVEELGENDVFGSKISFYIMNECEIVTTQDTDLVILDDYGIINYLHSDDIFFHQFVLNLYEISINIILERNERINILTKKTTRDKLLEYFNIASRKLRSRIIYLPFSFTDLADYLAVDRSAMSREMKHLKDEHIITVKGRKITLLYR